MKKKGFTLAELLGVISVLAIIALILIPNVINVINKNKEKAYDIQVSYIKEAMASYVSKNVLSIPSSGSIYLTLYQLADTGLIDYKISNPKNDKDFSLNSILKITNNGGEYQYDVSLVDVDSYTEEQINNLPKIELYNNFGEDLVSRESNIKSATYNDLDIRSDINITYYDDHYYVYNYSIQNEISISVIYTITYYYGKEVFFNPINYSICSGYEEDNSKNGYKDGCMKWYIIGREKDEVNLLLDHNTTAKVAWNSSGNKIDGMNEVKIALENDTKNWKPIARLITADEIALITGAKEILKWTSDKPYAQTPVIGNSISWYYLDGRYGNDSIWNTQVANENTKSKFAWLFDYTADCITYGCNNSDQSNSGYWTSTPVSDDENYAWSVFKNGYVFYYGDVDNNTDFGVRPVITIPKDLIF